MNVWFYNDISKISDDFSLRFFGKIGKFYNQVALLSEDIKKYLMKAAKMENTVLMLTE